MAFNFFGKKDKQTKENITVNENVSKKDAESDVLLLNNILLGQKSVSKEKAIEAAGRILVESGYVMPEYINAMQEREKVLTTYIGNGIAIPHGVGAARDLILKSGISIIQYPDGIEFAEDKVAYLVVGIAGKGNEHMKILSNLAGFIQEESIVKELFTATDKNKILNIFVSELE